MQSDLEQRPSFLSIIIFRFLGKILVSRYFILIINSFISYFLFKLFVAHLNPIQKDHLIYKEILEQFDGIAVILIGWGVALEERYTLRRIFYLINEETTEKELWLDDICHRYGVGYLIFGLFSEIFNECVRLPDNIIYTEGFNRITIRASEGLLGLSFILLVLFSWKLIKDIISNN